MITEHQLCAERGRVGGDAEGEDSSRNISKSFRIFTDKEQKGVAALYINIYIYIYTLKELSRVAF